MLFTSVSFLFVFLPIVLGIYFILKGTLARNLLLLASSLLFYAWGEQQFAVMLSCVIVNYISALLIDRTEDRGRARILLAACVAVNLGALAWYKYAGFAITNLDVLLEKLSLKALTVPEVILPLGISFYIFHSISYVVDVYRKVATAQKDPIKLGLYISFFPQLIAGPIVRYHEISDQLSKRICTAEKFSWGVRRFVVGLSKKMLIANSLAVPTDLIFAIPPEQLTWQTAWLGAICYTFQIYFDFSGYSDMAIGLAAIFGFRFPENFNYPYIARSIREFWQRWHMSLSNWFRDYLYIPLGGNRHGTARTCVNLATVFFLCGLWHGASFNFIIWGLYHGAFLGLERVLSPRIKFTIPRPVKHFYALLVVMIGWVFFRAETLPQALGFLRAMFGNAQGDGVYYNYALYLDAQLAFFLVVAALASMPVRKLAISIMQNIPQATVRLAARGAYVAALFTLSLAEIAAGTYNPFIYFRF
ncbi:MAG: MBOAT family protein [Candidatus Melainabacteria bacterium]|nr:MBOAT family protein [Candidatus Melainabacteria bacterium]